jgi:hypothetical protein
VKLIKYIVFGILFVGQSVIGTSQEWHPLLDRFHAIVGSESVQITCVISSGSTCNGMDVLRSTDSVYYEVIGNIAGVCGSDSKPVTYQFEDQNPVINGRTFYKLELGGYGFTEPIYVVIRDIPEGKAHVFPNPANAQAEIHFINPVKNTFQLSIRNLAGQSVYSRNTAADFFILNVANWDSGYYFIQLYSEESNATQTGVLVVTH